MQLYTWNYNGEESLATLKVSQISAAKLYYCFTGRNAWWSIWVQKYYEGCMHSSLESAKKYAEKKRVQGTVFYIEEIPALIFEAENNCLAVTQINCKEPMAEYSSDAISEKVSLSKFKIKNAMNNYLKCGASLEGVCLSFDYDSSFWKRLQPSENSIVRVMCKKAKSDQFVSLKPKEALFRFESYSVGSNYYLEWRKSESRFSPDSVLSLLS